MEQLERTRRYLKRIRNIYSGVPYIEETREYYTDDIYSFFIHCHHIRDWIAELNLTGITKKDLNEFVRKHNELRICADFCNGTKHCSIKEKLLWTTRQPHLVSKKFESEGRNNVIYTTKGAFEIMSEGKFYDALKLAESCMNLWDNFIEQMRKDYRSSLNAQLLKLLNQRIFNLTRVSPT